MNNLLKISLITLSLLSTSSNAWWWDKKDIVELPPHPGGAGKATLGGIDSDNDGVRDDIQIAIYDRYNSDAQKRAALTQTVKTLQSGLLVDTSSQQDVVTIAQEAGKNAKCLLDRLPSSEVTYGLIFLESILTNTEDRLNAYNSFNQASSGMIFEAYSGADNGCED